MEFIIERIKQGQPSTKEEDHPLPSGVESASQELWKHSGEFKTDQVNRSVIRHQAPLNLL